MVRDRPGGSRRGDRRWADIVIVLALDTATAATTAGITGDGLSVVRTVVDAHGHVENAGPLLRAVLDSARLTAVDIDVFACGVGPGPFTGLRVGIATLTAMATALGRPVVGVCTHDVIARGARLARGEGVPIAVITRARRAEVNWSTYDHAGLRTGGPLVLPHREARDRLAHLGDTVVAGDGVGALEYPVPERWRGPDYPDAGDLAQIVREQATPLSGIGVGDALDVERGIELTSATERGETTESVLLDLSRAGRVILPARPLYLRRPDAVAPVGVPRDPGA
jgi:tRNA threonylcarbamoyl adenosine modification protein YeaZ